MDWATIIPTSTVVDDMEEAMTSASNSLYRGELDGNPSAALKAIVEELEFEATQAERTTYGIVPDDDDLEFSARFRATAKKVDATRNHVNAAVNKALQGIYEQLAKEIREQQMAGGMSNEIADALVSGCWEGCAI